MPTLRNSMDLIADPARLDASLHEVFGTMLGAQCRHEGTIDETDRVDIGESVTAVVGFGGLLSGACVLRCDEAAARKIAGRLTGLEYFSVDDDVKDAIGEICNMLAGTWKSSVPSLSAHCGLSVPAVITGRDYNLHVQAPEFRIRRDYSFEDLRLEMTIICDSLR